MLKSKQVLTCECLDAIPTYNSITNVCTLFLCVRTLPGAYLRVNRTAVPWVLICDRCLKMKGVYGIYQATIVSSLKLDIMILFGNTC